MNSEVTKEHLPHNNRKFAIRFTGECEEMVRRSAEKALKETDSMSSPRLSAIYRHGEFFACDLTWYSVD